MTLQVVHSGYKAIYEPRAVAWTSAPETFAALERQRLRWDRGNLQVWRIYRDSLFSRGMGAMTMFWLPYLFIFGFGIVLVQAIVLVASIVYFAVNYPFPVDALAFSLALIVLLEVISFMQFAAILFLDGSLRPNLVLAAATIKPYLLFLFGIRIVAIYREAQRKEVTWSG
jgi:cellulose synthase/poly-beta-1,6-N-acetylglucosamine synthase-like glycosyltransferase